MSHAGQFRERILLVQPAASVSDGVGGFASSIPSERLLPARVQVQGGREQLRPAGLLEAEQRYKVTLRYEAGITSCDTLVWEGITLGITTVTPNERRTETILTCYAIG